MATVGLNDKWINSRPAVLFEKINLYQARFDIDFFTCAFCLKYQEFLAILHKSKFQK